MTWRHGGPAALALALVACTRAPKQPTQAPESVTHSASERGRTLLFNYVALDGAPLSTDSVRGRLTVIGFATTYDFASQAEARFLTGILRRHTPRVNVALLVLEPADNRPLVEAFAHTLGLTYPVALADEATIAGQGAFAGLHQVPSVVILDREGREAYRHVGLVQEQDIDAALREIESTDHLTR